MALRNHIVRIESFRYLPTEYLEMLLSAVEADSTTALEPEEPIPLDGSIEAPAGIAVPGDDEDEEVGMSQFLGSFSITL